MKYTTLRADRHNNIITLQINRPNKLNALSDLVLNELDSVLATLAADDALRGVLLTGVGERAFVAGADIASMRPMSPQHGAAFGRLGQRVTQRIEALPVPVVACVNGYALGGGCEMAMACDFIYATANAVFGQPEVSLGLIPGFGGLARLIRYIGPGHAKELIYSGRKLEAQQAERLGLVNRVFVSRDEMMRAAEATITEIASRSRIAVGLCKSILTDLDGRSIADQLALENRGFERVFESAEMREGTAAFLEKRPPAFQPRVG